MNALSGPTETRESSRAPARVRSIHAETRGKRSTTRGVIRPRTASITSPLASAQITACPSSRKHSGEAPANSQSPSNPSTASVDSASKFSVWLATPTAAARGHPTYGAKRLARTASHAGRPPRNRRDLRHIQRASSARAPRAEPSSAGCRARRASSSLRRLPEVARSPRSSAAPRTPAPRSSTTARLPADPISRASNAVPVSPTAS